MNQPDSPFPAADGSILAPIRIGYQIPDGPVDSLRLVWTTAAGSIPVTKPVLNVLGGDGKTQRVTHTRMVFTGTGPSCLHAARLCDVRAGEKAAGAWDRWHWEVSARDVTNNQALSSAGDMSATVRLEVTYYRISAGHVQAAAELALFRHLVVAGLRAIDPGLSVAGGQHDWQDDWWRLPEQTPT